MMLWYIQVGNLIVMVVLLSYWCQFDFSIDSAQHSMHSFTSLLERKELNWSYCHCIKYIVVFGIFSIQTNTLHHSPMQEFVFIFANISWASKIEWLYWCGYLYWIVDIAFNKNVVNTSFQVDTCIFCKVLCCANIIENVKCNNNAVGAVKAICFVYTNSKEYALMYSYVRTISSEILLYQWKSKPFCWIHIITLRKYTENKEVLRK